MNAQFNLVSSNQINSAAPASAGNLLDTGHRTGTPGFEQLAGDKAELCIISGLVAKTMTLPDIRMDKVEAIKARIAAGVYDLNSSETAEAMITSPLI